MVDGPLQRSKFLRSGRARRLALQTAVLFLVLLLVGYLMERASHLDLDVGFLAAPAGFQISHTFVFDFDSTGSRFVGYIVAVTNTVRIVIIGIVFATLIGVIAGVARLSDNWLVSRIATVYIEIIRNTPLLVQIIFWYTAVFLKMPRIESELNLFDVIFLSNRALAIPWLEPRGDLFPVWIVVVIFAFVLGYFVRRRRAQRQAETGRTRHPNLFASTIVLAIVFLSYLGLGLPLELETPKIVTEEFTQAYSGGVSITPEFIALLVALVLYTGSFIAEIVRGSIQAVPRGQSEAASALGLSPYQRLTLVIMPQALRTMIPPVTNEYLNLTKNSSLAAAIAYSDLFQISEIIVNKAGHAVVMFMIVIITYQLMSFTISAFMSFLNRRVQLVDS